MKHLLIRTLALAAVAAVAGCGPNAGMQADGPIEDAAGTAESLFGIPADARRIVYVVDCSGSMFDTFEVMQDALRQDISRRTAEQQFHVVCFGNGDVAEYPGERLAPATDARKAEALALVAKLTPKGRTEPAKAIERAFAATDADGRHADLICLLSDGEFDPQILQQIERLQEAGASRIRISTVHFSYDGDLLMRIAEANGGTCRFVSASQVRR